MSKYNIRIKDKTLAPDTLIMSKNKKKIVRFIQKKITIYSEKIRFKTSHITLGGKISLLGAIIIFLSLFFTWLRTDIAILALENNKIDATNSFSSLLGFVGFFILFTIMFIIFSIFSIQKKEKFKFFSLIHIYDHAAAFYGAIFIIILSLQSFLYISGLQVFASNIIYGKGIIISITGSIVLIYGAISMKNEYRKNIKGSYISEIKNTENSNEKQETKNNMKLPF